jgi:phospholipid/cholesterol/gamma-HCH transport system substrate-binding protein
MNEQKLRFRIGLFVAASLVVLLALTVLFTGLPSFFIPTNRYVLVLPSAERVTPGTPVRRSGVRIGEVTKVELDDETGKVRLTIALPRNRTIPKNEVPVLTRSIIGDPAIDFVPRPLPDGGAVPPGSEIAGTVQPDVSSSLGELNKAAENLNRLAGPAEKTLNEIGVTAKTWGGLGENTNVLLKTNEQKLIKTLDNMNETFQRASDVLSPENQRNLNATLKNVRAASDTLDTLTKDTDEVMKDTRNTLKQLNASLKQLDQVMDNLDKITRPMADRGGAITKNIDESAEKLNKTLTSMQELFGAFGKTDSTAYRLLNDPGLYNNLNVVAYGIAKMLPTLDRTLKDLEVFADKIARHPEALGVGGVVKPGSGLK